MQSLQERKSYYTFESLLDSATISYQTLLDLDQLGAKVHNKDTSAASEGMSAEVNALVQKAIAKLKKGFKREHKNTNTTTNYDSKTTNKLKKSNWKTEPPKSNEPQTKTVDGLDWHWRAKCYGGRWSASHRTEDHKAGETTPSTDTKKYTNETNVHEVCDLYCQWTNEEEVWVSEVEEVSKGENSSEFNNQQNDGFTLVTPRRTRNNNHLNQLRFNNQQQFNLYEPSYARSGLDELAKLMKEKREL